MAKYNVTKIVPDGFLHHMGFDQVIESLSWSLSALGHEVNVTQNWLSEQREHNIIFGAELIADFQRLPPATTIFNLEQPSHPNMGKVQRMAKESGVQVWDYSLRAVEEWKSFGHEKVKHLPIGYTPNLRRIPHMDPDIDVLFYGWMTPRRIALIDELKKHGLNIVSTSTCYGGGRDNLISRSKVVLNVHHDGRDRFEIVRCSYLMANEKCVVSESSSDDDEYQDLRGLTIVPYRLLVDTCRSLCSIPSERLNNQELAMESIRKRDFTKAVESVLDSTEPSSSVMVRKAYRVVQKRDYLKQGREIKRDPRVPARYSAASRVGDMKDFVRWMYDHAKGNIVEIGVRDGASTSAFLAGVEERGGHVYSIDIENCGHLFNGHPQWTFIHGDSRSNEVYRSIPGDIDLLLIDGDHSYSGVSGDFEWYAPKVQPRGLILFHDIAPEPNPGNIPDWPDDSVKNFYESLCSSGWEHEEVPGRYGMGVLRKAGIISASANKVVHDGTPIEVIQHGAGVTQVKY